MIQKQGWYFKTQPIIGGGLAWCARTPELRDGPVELLDAGEVVHFEFGATEKIALAALEREVLR